MQQLLGGLYMVVSMATLAAGTVLSLYNLD